MFKKFLTSLFLGLNFIKCDTPVAEKELYLIPSGVIGHITLSFGVTDGLTPEYEGNSRVYKINNQGEYKSNAPIKLGIKPKNTYSFWLVDKNNQRTLIPFYTTAGLDQEQLVVSDFYVVNNMYHFFIDALKNIHNYKNPAIDENGRGK
jgi:hypothetical protein